MALTAEQLKERAEGIGASEAAASVGLSKYTSTLALYIKKIAANDGTYTEDNTLEDQLRLDGGSALEPVILNHFERTTNHRLQDKQLRIVDPKYPWRWVTCDARTVGELNLVEAKKTEIVGAQWGEGDEDVPDDYYCQAQQGMACSGAGLVYVPVLLPRWEFAVYTIKRDDEFIELMTGKQLEFIQRLRDRNPPPPQSLEDCKLIWPKHKAKKFVTADEVTVKVMQEFANVRKVEKDSKEKKEAYQLALQRVIGDAEGLRAPNGELLATWTNNKDGFDFDEKRFKLEEPAMHAKYLVPRPGARVFRCKIEAETPAPTPTQTEG